jgi:hypothetical protein
MTSNPTDTNNEELRTKIEAWYEESFEIDLKRARANWPGNRCGADDAIDELLKLITSRDQQIALAARIERLETGRHVAFQIIDGISPHQLHAAYTDQLVKLKLDQAAQEKS